jgi:hypothetical protein
MYDKRDLGEFPVPPGLFVDSIAREGKNSPFGSATHKFCEFLRKERMKVD